MAEVVASKKHYFHNLNHCKMILKHEQTYLQTKKDKYQICKVLQKNICF
jgi:hypothetical protein